ncbi:unnamed protein product [marine sediment metagenome]|uniref:HK97 gp10 family phage protein n=1 Tax=marine sediment metagenome TaxID=412755 RepID=X0YTN8_9ZZZZ
MAAKVKWYGKEVIKKISNANKQIISKACLLVERDAKILCPVDTGRLRSSITHEIEGTTGRVGSNVEYARIVELGSEDPAFRRRPQPYLRPALHKNEKKILALFKKII